MKKPSEINNPTITLDTRAGSKFIRAKFRLPGITKPIHRSTGKVDERQANRWALDLYDELYPLMVTNDGGQSITLERACEAYLTAKKDDVDHGTWIMNRTICRRMQGFKSTRWIARIPVPGLIEGDSYIHTIDQAAFDAFLATMKKKGVYAAATYKAHVGRIKEVFEFWKGQGYSFTMPKFPGKKHYEKSNAGKATFTEEQKDELLSIVRASKNPDNVLLMTMHFDLPIRHGEAVATRFDNVYIDKRLIWCVRSKGSESGWAVMSNRLVELFKLHQHNHGSTGYVFASDDTATGHRTAKNDKWFKRAVRKLAGDPNHPDAVRRTGKKYSIHSARYGLGQAMGEMGLSAPSIQKAFGHASIRQAMHYVEITDNSATLALAAKLDAIEADKIAARKAGKPAE